MATYKVYIVEKARNASSNWTFLYKLEAETDEQARLQYEQDKKQRSELFRSGGVDWRKATKLTDNDCRRIIA